MWKPVKSVFLGGSSEAGALFGKKIMTIKPTEMPLFDGVTPRPGSISLPRGEGGFIGRVPAHQRDAIILVFCGTGNMPSTIDQAMRQSTKIGICNWPTFRENFYIDV